MVCSRGASLTNRITQMKLFNAIAAAAIGASFVCAAPSASAQTYRVTPSLMNDGSYTVRGSNGYGGRYNSNMMGGGTYRDNNGGGYGYTPNMMGGGTIVSVDLYLGTPDAYWLRAMQNPQGKSMGR